jgi:hypothetical protein
MSTSHLIEMNLIKRVLEEKGLKQTWLSEKLGKSYDIVMGLKNIKKNTFHHEFKKYFGLK